MRSLYKNAWEALERPESQPRRVQKIVVVDFAEFQRNVLAQEAKFVESLVVSLYSGDGYVLKGAFSKEFVSGVIRRTYEWGKLSPSSFHKMYQDCPDFHRIIDHELAKLYSFAAVRHSYYFFPWNGDPLGIFPAVNERWRIFKLLGGFPLDAYERNKPLDGVIDRIQVAHYPSGGGGLEPHSDPYVNQRVIIGAMMSKRGVDYQSGGFYFVDGKDQKIVLEDEADVGDIVCGYPTVVHGVEVVDEHKKLDWSSMDGRWFLGLYSNDSDHVKDKQRGYAVKV